MEGILTHREQTNGYLKLLLCNSPSGTSAEGFQTICKKSTKVSLILPAAQTTRPSLERNKGRECSSWKTQHLMSLSNLL